MNPAQPPAAQCVGAFSSLLRSGPLAATDMPYCENFQGARGNLQNIRSGFVHPTIDATLTVTSRGIGSTRWRDQGSRTGRPAFQAAPQDHGQALIAPEQSGFNVADLGDPPFGQDGGLAPD